MLKNYKKKFEHERKIEWRSLLTEGEQKRETFEN